MVVFVTSLKHPETCDYAIVSRLFEMSVRSICHQSDPEYHVVVVCNQKPRVDFSDERVTYHVVDFSAPKVGVPRAGWSSPHELDKGTKLLSGILLARRFSPNYFAIFDADDLMSKRIAGFVNADPGTAGWFVDCGYVLNYSTRRFRKKYGFVRYCGTSLIPSADAIFRMAGAHAQINESSGVDELVADGRRSLVELLGNHRKMSDYFSRPPLRMRNVPFPAAVWVQATGENQNRDPGIQGGLPLTAAFCEEFGLPSPTGKVPKATLGDHLDEALSRLRSRSGALFARMSPDRH